LGGYNRALLRKPWLATTARGALQQVVLSGLGGKVSYKRRSLIFLEIFHERF